MKRTALVFLAAVCAAALSIATTANAGSQPIPSKEIAPEPIPEFSWTGFYIGGNLGGMWSNFNFSAFDDEVDIGRQFVEVELANPVASSTAGDMGSEFSPEFFSFGGGSNGATGFDAGSDDSFIGGGQIGYNRQFGHFVIGVEGDFDRTSTHRTESFSASTQQFFFFPQPMASGTSGIFPSIESLEADTTVTASRRAELEWMASARGRLGWANGHVLLYVTGGAAFAEVNTWAKDSATSSFFFNEEILLKGPSIFNHFPIGTVTDTNVSENCDILTGWTGGGGGEWAITDMVSVGVEYRHTDLGSHTFHFDSHGGPVIAGPSKIDIECDQVTVRFNILLNSFFGH